MSSPPSPSGAATEYVSESERSRADDDISLNSWERSPSEGEEGEVEMDHDPDLASPDFDLLDNLRRYLHGPTSPDETSEYDVRLDQPVEDSSSSEVMSFTRNLAHRVRESFSGISSGLQRAGDVHSLLSEDESSPGHSRSTQPQNMYSFNVVLLDPAVDIIPRRKFRDALRQDGRIVELSLPRGAQGPEAQKKLTSAFPHFIARARQSHRYGNPPFQVLVTDKSARNNLVPANPPAHGFTARELHKVAGQGSLYLRLFEDPTTSRSSHRTQSRVNSRTSGSVSRAHFTSSNTTSTSTRSSSLSIAGLGAFPSSQSRIPVPIPGMLPHISGSGSSVEPSARNVTLGAIVSSRSSGTFRDSSLVATGLMPASTRTSATATATATRSVKSPLAISTSTHTVTTTTSVLSTRVSSRSGGTSLMARGMVTAPTHASVNATGTGRDQNSRVRSSPAVSTSTHTSATDTGMGRDRSNRVRSPSPVSTSTYTSATDTGMGRDRSNRVRSPSPVSTSTRTSASDTGTGRDRSNRVRSSPPVSTSTRTSATHTGTGRDRRSRARYPPPVATSTHTSSTHTGRGRDQSNRVRSPPAVSTSTRTSATSTETLIVSGRSTVSTSTGTVATATATRDYHSITGGSRSLTSHTSVRSTGTRTDQGSTSRSALAISTSSHTSEIVTGTSSGRVASAPDTFGADAGLTSMVATPNTTVATSTMSTSNTLINPTSTSTVVSSEARHGNVPSTPTSNIVSSTVTSVNRPGRLGVHISPTAVVGADARSRSNESTTATPSTALSVADGENTLPDRGRRWRATLPAVSADIESVDDGTGLSIDRTGSNSAPSVSSRSTSDFHSSASVTITTAGISRLSVTAPSALATGVVELPEASVLLDLIPENQGHVLSPLESCIRMTHYPSLPFSHPCTFHTLMEMSRLDGELGKPALVCICSERQWLLWRPIFENSEITKLVNENFIFWAQPSDHGAEGKQGLAAINQHNNNTGIVAIVCSRAVGEIKVLLEVTGLQSVADLKRILNEALRKFKEQRNELMALQRERELKRQQDLEYKASQKADMEKEQRKRNSKACQCSQEPKEVPVEEEKTDEPPPKRLKSSELKRLIVVLPDGKRHQMDVASNSTLMKLYEQVNNLLPEGSEPIILSYQLEGGLWRKLPKHTMTVDEFGVVENVILRASNSSESNTAS